MEIKGTVTKVTDFGAFVEIEDGIEGLLHISQIKDETPNATEQEGEVISVQELLKVDDKIKVTVVRISSEERKIGLSLVKKLKKKTT